MRLAKAKLAQDLEFVRGWMSFLQAGSSLSISSPPGLTSGNLAEHGVVTFLLTWMEVHAILT
jgi:hypothetical protein